MKVKLNHKYIYPDMLSPEMLDIVDNAINGHRKAWEYPEIGLGKPVCVWFDNNKYLCIEYITPDNYKHWYHYRFHDGGDFWQSDGWEWW